MKNKFYFIGSMVVMLLSSISINTEAQQVVFDYDSRGNRIRRQYIASGLMDGTAKAEQIAAQYGVGVYPNPLMDGSSVTVAIERNKTVEETSDNPEEAIVYVLDNTGKVLFSKKQTTSSPSQIDLSGYSAGIYHIKIAIRKEILFYKVVKAK